MSARQNKFVIFNLQKQFEFDHQCIQIHQMLQESYTSQQQLSSYSNQQNHLQQNRSTLPHIIQSNLIYQNPNRQVDQLYQNICEKNLHPREWLKKSKSNENVSFKYKNSNKIQTKSTQKNVKANISLQDEIVLSNYKQILRNQFHFQTEKDHQYNELYNKYQEQHTQNLAIRNENTKLKKELIKIKKKQSQRQAKIIKLDNSLKQLSRRYQNLLKQSQTRQNLYKSETKRLREQKVGYSNLVQALKESIHILKGKKVKDLSQIWNQWKHIFQIASLQQCKLVKKNTRP